MSFEEKPTDAEVASAKWYFFGLIFLYFPYTMFTQGWRAALAVFLAISGFIAIAVIFSVLAKRLSRVTGEKFAFGLVGVLLVLVLIAPILVIALNWGK